VSETTTREEDGPPTEVAWRPGSGSASTAGVAYRAVLLAALLVVMGFFIRQLLTLALVMVLTVTIALALSAATTRLERLRVPRVLGASMVLAAVLAALAGVGVLIAQPLASETDRLRENVPEVAEEVGAQVESLTGRSPDRLVEEGQEFALTLLSPQLVTSVVTALAGVLLVLVTALYIAIRPQPLVDGLLRLVAPGRRGWARHLLQRLRTAWLGWLLGTLLNMVVVGVLLYVAFAVLGLRYALLLAVLGALGEFVPYFGPVLVSIPAVLIALADSLELAVITTVVIVVIQQVEGNVLVPVIMARTVSLHPAVVAVGVVAVATALGPVALLVAVPVISAVVILVEELWVRPREQVAEDASASPRRRVLRFRPRRRGASEAPNPRQVMSVHDQHTSRHRDRRLAGRRVAFLVANEGIEQSELAEPMRAVRAEGGRAEIVAPHPGTVQAMSHLNKADIFPVSIALEDGPDPDDFDALVLPGGVANPDRLRMDERAVAFVRRFMEAGRPVAAICHAPWLLVEADVVRGRTLTSWPSLITDIENAGGQRVNEEVCVDGNLITSRSPEDLPAFCAALVEAVAGTPQAAVASD